MLKTELFSKLDTEQKLIVEQNIFSYKFAKNSSIFQGSQKNNGIYCVKSGIIKRFIHGVENRESIFDIIGPSDFFGHRVLFTRDDYFDSATSITETEIQYLSKEIFQQLLRSNTKFMEAYISLLSTESINYVQQVQIMGQLSLRERTAYALMYIQSKNADPNNMIVGISREDLANYLGTVKESAVRVLHEFKSKGWLLSTGRNMEILAPEELRRISRV